MFRVYDSRTNETLFESKDKDSAIYFIWSIVADENDPDFPYIWLDESQ